MIQFPELDFLHIPSFLRKLKDLEASSTDILGQNNPIHSDGKLVGLCSALLALCAPWLDDKCPREDRASTARSSLSVTDLPNIYTVQTQLILAMYEWGRGRTYRAWTDSGMYDPMIRSLHSKTCIHYMSFSLTHTAYRHGNKVISIAQHLSTATRYDGGMQ